MTLQRLQVGRYSCVSISFIYVVSSSGDEDDTTKPAKEIGD
jgi:hypothetical protein